MKLRMRRKGASVQIIGRHLFQKQHKTRFKTPDHIRELLTRMEAGYRENYPSLVRYEEILTDARSAFTYLNCIVAPKEHACEAAKIRDKIEREFAQLSVKVRRNVRPS
jgi:hypothetical protein